LEVSPVGQGDDKARFLAEFRALRDRVAIDFEELAARTHYPSDVLKDAENGPGLPGLPVLAAYVRACGGDVAEWEERWRRLALAADDESGLPTRPAGASAAAVAGARAGVTVGPAEAADTERIRAALKAHRQREEASRARVTDVSLSGRPATGQRTMVANGAHHKEPREDAFDSSLASAQAAATTGPPAQAPAAEADEGFHVFSGASRAPGMPGASEAPGAPSRGREREREKGDSPAPSASFASAAARLAGRRNLTSRPGLLVAIVVAVVIVCIAALALT
jgi:Helix-turn-helix domain